MTECEIVRPLSTAWIDGELQGAERTRVESHVRRCPACRALAEAERAARAVVRERQAALTMTDPAPAGLRDRCRRATTAGASTRRRRRVLVAVAATLALAISGWTLRLATERSTTVLAAQLAADHVKCHLFAGTTDAEASVVQQRLLAEYGFHARVPPTSPDRRFRLLGARRCLTGEGTNAHMLYEVDGRPVSLYLVPSGARAGGDIQVLGKHAHVWSRHNGTYVLVADQQAADLPRLAAYMEHATE
jgi:anti-sigma factor RsiW